jgi:hypothetical protein
VHFLLDSLCLQFADCDALPSVPSPPSAEDCINATAIDTSVFFGDSGNTDLTDVQAFPKAFECSLVGDSTKGVWYTLEGDGTCFYATTLGSGFDTILSVYTGEAFCQDLVCLTENDDGSGGGYGYGGYEGGFGLSSKVVWRTEMGQSYYILLGGLGISSGPYRFSLEVRGNLLCCVFYIVLRCDRPLLLLLQLLLPFSVLLSPLFTNLCACFYSILPRVTGYRLLPNSLQS